ncbi:MAG: hypothetical protein IPI54_14790 [Chitinophagaceae bacterium]|nr:hypothetical protein [Chitinophagaceae bacterium]
MASTKFDFSIIGIKVINYLILFRQDLGSSIRLEYSSKTWKQVDQLIPQQESKYGIKESKQFSFTQEASQEQTQGLKFIAASPKHNKKSENNYTDILSS